MWRFNQITLLHKTLQWVAPPALRKKSTLLIMASERCCLVWPLLICPGTFLTTLANHTSLSDPTEPISVPWPYHVDFLPLGFCTCFFFSQEYIFLYLFQSQLRVFFSFKLKMTFLEKCFGDALQPTHIPPSCRSWPSCVLSATLHFLHYLNKVYPPLYHTLGWEICEDRDCVCFISHFTAATKENVEKCRYGAIFIEWIRE